jgi:hypothetical protein
MTLYNVHIYREMRLKYEGIEAATPEQAAQIAGDKPTHDADEIEDCEGYTSTALVDVVGDEEYQHSRWIDFDPERLRNAAPDMLHALREFIAIGELADECGEWKWESLEHAFDLARAAIAKATILPTNQPERRIP